MRILILGGTRFIGPYIVRHLVESGHDVTVFHRGQTTAQLPSEVQTILGDRRELESFRPIFAQVAPNVVLDMYAMCERDALDSTRTLSGIPDRLVVASSVDVYQAYSVLLGIEEGPPEPTPLNEDSALRTRLHLYREKNRKILDRLDDYDKIPVERVVLTQRDLPGTVVRLPMVYGPGDIRHRLYPFLRRMDCGRSKILLPESVAQWQGAWSYVENAALAIALAVSDERAAGRIYQVSELEPITELERLSQLAKIAAWPGQFIVVPDEQLPSWKPPLNFAQHWAADSTRIRQELGYAEVVDREESLRRAVIWQRSNPPSSPESATSDFLVDEALEDEWLAV